MLGSAPHKGTFVTGEGRGLATPLVAGTVTESLSSVGRGAKFDGNAVGHGMTTGIVPHFNAVSAIVVVKLTALAADLQYYEIIAQGSTFANETAFTFNLRQSGSGNSKTNLLLFNKHSGTIRGIASVAGLTSDDLKVGSVAVYGFSYDGLNGAIYIDGFPISMQAPSPGQIAISNITSTYPLTLGSGSNQTSSSRSWNGDIYGAIIAHDQYWTDAQHAQLASDPFGPVTMADDYPAWMPVPVSSIPFPPLFHRDVESRTRLRM